jgi:hypothetical protein
LDTADPTATSSINGQFDELKRPYQPGQRRRENRAMADLAPLVSMVALEATPRRELCERSGSAELTVS